MRRSIEFLLLLLVCGASCFVLDLYVTSRPTLISGTVVDWTTGRPVPDAEVRFKEMNGSKPAARTDLNGRFTTVAPDNNRFYLLYAGGREFNSVLQAFFGRAVLITRRGERLSGVVVPAIPSTDVSGHVYDGDMDPLGGCDVSALTEDVDPDRQIYAVETFRTDNGGAFSFNRLGADRYFLVARCHRYLPNEQQSSSGVGAVPWRIRDSWLTETKPIVLMPGDRQQGIDFHLQSAPQYSVRGGVTFSNGSRPLPGEVYIHEMRAVQIPQRLEGESCSWDTASADFHCDFLSPGAYKLTFEIDGWPDQQIGKQKAELAVRISPQQAPQPELNVQLKKWEPAPPLKQSSADAGFLRLRRICDGGTREPWIAVRAWGPTREPSLPLLQNLGCGSEKTWPVADGEYLIGGYQVGSFGGRITKLEALLRRHGSSVTIAKGTTSELSLRSFSTDEIIRMALQSLRDEESPKKR